MKDETYAVMFPGPVLIDLPPGCTVRPSVVVGVEFLDESGRVLTYHPNDGNSIRRLVWDIWRRIHAT